MQFFTFILCTFLPHNCKRLRTAGGRGRGRIKGERLKVKKKWEGWKEGRLEAGG